MDSSPGPSTSNSPLEDHKKRTRRKERHRNLNKPIPFTPNYVIAPNLVSPCVFYRQREKAGGPIYLNSFCTNSLPLVFFTGKQPTCSVEELRTKFEQLNGAKKTEQVKKSRTRKRKETKFKFGKYLSHNEVVKGLADGTLIKGYIRVNPRNPQESYISNEDSSKMDYVIPSLLARNRALDGDGVIIRLKKDDSKDKRTCAEVVCLSLLVHPRTAIGQLEPIQNNKDYAMFKPRDYRFPKLKVSKLSWPPCFDSNPLQFKDTLFLAKMTEWNEVDCGIGVIIDNLGMSGDLKVESKAILKEFGLDVSPFGNEIRQFLPQTNQIDPKEYEYRLDLRSECIFTIDPLTAKDLDDAVSCKQLSNGNFEVGVHISDASFYLAENTDLNEIVRQKATTIYMVDTAYHMLPVELCLLCSLLPNQDKLAFSIIWELTPSGEIVNQKITRSVINSCTQLAYEHAQMMLDCQFSPGDLPEIHNGFSPEHIAKCVNNLNKIAVCLREKRRLNGSLKIDQVKIGFVLEPVTGKPRDFYICENKPAHRLIEEFMLLANMSVAKVIEEKFPKLAFLRLHEPPKATMMLELQKNLETIGIHLDITSSGGIQASLDKYSSDDFLGQSRMLVLNHLLAKPMQRARYFCAGAIDDMTYTHFALSIPIYTHFTSPIRRYADIMVHRLLSAALNYTESPDWDPELVAMIAERCNRQKYNAKRAGEASCDLYLSHYIDSQKNYIEKAVVVETKERSVDIIVPKTGSVLRLYTNNFEDNVKWESQEIKNDSNDRKTYRMIVRFPRTQTQDEAVIVLEIFTIISVELIRKPKTNKLEAKLLRP